MEGCASHRGRTPLSEIGKQIVVLIVEDRFVVHEGICLDEIRELERSRPARDDSH